ncbi:MAG: phosphonoacetate hydrolase [SAR324 cluster bacterium]|nr:phosphonoacetate hydrolase [SAR324 cluster bacterium]
MQNSKISVNGRLYSRSERPVVVVCIDGSQPEYMTQAMAKGSMPWLKRTLENHGTDRIADSVVPSFTNPNNISIVTGVPPSMHGICGNFFYNRDTDEEVMMDDTQFLRAGTIFKAFQDAQAKVVAITAKDKLRKLLGYELKFTEGSAICFSAEKADQTSLHENGIENVLEMVGMPVASVYSAELSEFVFAAGVKIMERERPELMYLSTTDFIQHKYAPGTDEANAFYQMMDAYWAQLDEMETVITLTADHGMNAKHDDEGNPEIVFLQELFDQWYGKENARVILPITDPYVVHHGALGSFATVYLSKKVDANDAIHRLRSLDGITMALSGAAGCRYFELSEDRLGDIIIVSGLKTTLGTMQERHDLSALKLPLRSHGGTTEQKVPFLSNRPMPKLPPDMHLRNFDAFYASLNYAE